jgi:PAS domain S-box-containing protein
MRAVESLSDEVLAAVVRGAGDAVIVANRTGAISYWNAAAEAMFGHPASEVLGESLDLIIPEALRERHWEGFRHTMATGETQYAGRTLAVPAIRADGTRISVEFTVALLTDAAGAVSAIAAIMRDVTEAWQERRALARRMRELEAGRPAAPRPSGGEESATAGRAGARGTGPT